MDRAIDTNPASPLLYLYGVIPAGQALPAGTPVKLVARTVGPLAAMVEEVGAAEFSPELLEERLQKLEFVAPLAERHHAVLEAASRVGPVVPARLCTLFSDDRALAASLDERRDALVEVLGRLEGRAEWGVKVYCEPETATARAAERDPQAKALAQAAAKGTEGQMFILRKRREARLAEAVAARSQEVAEQVSDAVDPLAGDLRFRPLRSDLQPDRKDQMILNLALLLSEEEQAEVERVVEELAAELEPDGYRLELGGPWPPYSFTTDEEEEDDLLDDDQDAGGDE